MAAYDWTGQQGRTALRCAGVEKLMVQVATDTRRQADLEYGKGAKDLSDALHERARYIEAFIRWLKESP